MSAAAHGNPLDRAAVAGAPAPAAARRWRRAALPVLLVVAPPASAHLVSTGLGPVYDGIAHFLLSIPTLLPLLALLLCAALAGASTARFGALALPALWTGAGLAALALPLPLAAAEMAPALVLMLAGLLTALDRHWPPATLACLLAATALLLGWSEGTALRALNGAGWMLLGAACTLFVAASIVAGLVLTLSNGQSWRRIVIRVGGSWLGGIGLLLLGWQLRH